MINYKNIQEGYEADCTTVSYSWGKTCVTQVHQGTVGVRPEVNREDSMHRTALCLASAWLPGENTKVSPTSFSWSNQEWPRTCSVPGLAKQPPRPLPRVPETAPVQERGLGLGEHLPYPSCFSFQPPNRSTGQEKAGSLSCRGVSCGLFKNKAGPAVTWLNHTKRKTPRTEKAPSSGQAWS